MNDKILTVKDLIDYLQTLPQEAILVTNNSRGWAGDRKAELATIEELRRYSPYLLKKQVEILYGREQGYRENCIEEIKRKYGTDFRCVTIYDSRTIDY